MGANILGSVMLVSLLSLAGCGGEELREAGQAGAFDGCQIGGCSGQYCLEVDRGTASTCEWQAEYACYRAATCERQSNGKCQWRITEELLTCLSSN